MNLGKNASSDNLPCSFVIFGATGNLASNKLLPALYHLEAAARLAESLTIIAFSRRDWTTETWREHMRETLDGKIKGSLDTPVFERFIARFSYFKGDLNDVASYHALAERLPPESACSSAVFYLAIKPA
jgi:glucose-6-phosphate 1-dehydrogenase